MNIRLPVDPMAEKLTETLACDMTDAIGVDHQGKITIWNQSATKMFGYSSKQAIGMSLYELIVPDHMHQKAQKGFKAFAASGKGPMIGKTTECIAKRKDNSRFPAEVSVSGFKPKGHHWQAVAVVRDISKRKQIDGVFQANQCMIDHYSDESFWIDQDGHFVNVNKTVCRKLGYTRDALLGMTIFDIDPIFSRHSWPKHWKNLKKRGSFHLESVHKTSSGKTFPVDISMNYICFGDIEYNFAFAVDITERKQAESVLGKVEVKYQKLVDSVAALPWTYDITHDRFTFLGEQIKTMLGIRPNTISHMKDWMKLIHPDDRKITAKFAIEETKERSHYEVEHRMRLADGSWTWVKNVISVEFVQNKPVGLSGFMFDINEKKKVQEALEESREQLKVSLTDTVIAVSRAVGARDPYTAGHQQRVSQLSCAIARKMRLHKQQIEGLRMGAAIHDIGKIHLPAEILVKPIKLTDIEYALVKSHSQVGYDILKDISFPWPVADIVYQHHERMDGSGYPLGLKGNAICLEARIVSVADVVEAMNSHRPYRAALGMDAALQEIETHRGQWFDPAAVDACLALCREKDFTFE
ncbi:MAG: PAS domain S-box protein [Mariprofundus sp.]|nr:PAS domain S-box protein [Mariprofundus sp.]